MLRRCMRETKVNYRTGESLDIRSVDLFIGIESREGPERPKSKGLYTLRTFYPQIYILGTKPLAEECQGKPKQLRSRSFRSCQT